MLVITFAFKQKIDVPVEVRKLRPDVVASLQTISDIRKLPVWIGNRKVEAQEVFDIVVEGKWTSNINDIIVRFVGKSTCKLRYVGYRMKGGKIEVEGPVGPLAGYRMENGELIVHGDADHYLGAKMKGGKIEVFGNAGSFVGGKLVGEKYGKGMSGGTIIVHGNAGSFIGHGMKRGDIIVEGSVQNFPGYGMKGGNIVILGDCGLYPGARMSGGRIVIRGRVEDILPSFYIDDIVQGVKIKNITLPERYALFVGDVLMESRGRLYINYEANRHIVEQFEELLKQEVIDIFE